MGLASLYQLCVPEDLNWAKFDEQLKENWFVAGYRFTVADITALCSTDFARLVGIQVPQDCPKFARW